MAHHSALMSSCSHMVIISSSPSPLPHNFCHNIICNKSHGLDHASVTVDSGSKPESKLMLDGETCKVTWERIRLSTIHWYIVSMQTDINFYDCVYQAKGGSLLLARVTTIPPHYWEQYILCAFSMHQQTAVERGVWRLWSKDRLGWDFLAGIRVSRSMGKCDDNKEM